MSDDPAANAPRPPAPAPAPAPAPLVAPGNVAPLSIPWIRIAFGLLIGAACIWQLIRNQANWGDVGRELRSVQPAWLALALALLLIDYGFRVLRWWVLVAALAPGISPGRCAGPLFAGFALNNVLPMRLGDVARGALFTRELGLGASAVFATLTLERLIDLLVLLLVFAAGTLALPDGSLDPKLVSGAGAAAVVGAVAVVVALALPGPLGALFAGIATRLGAHPLARASGWIATLFAAIARLRDPRTLVPALVLSLFAWGFELAVFVAVAHAVRMPCHPFDPPFAVASGSLATLVPSTPGHIGIFDFFCQKALLACGIQGDIATTFTVVVHLIMLVPLTVLGLGWLALRRRPAA